MKATYTDSYLNYTTDTVIYYHINGLPSLKGWYVKGEKIKFACAYRHIANMLDKNIVLDNIKKSCHI
jgi:hypothetical protein